MKKKIKKKILIGIIVLFILVLMLFIVFNNKSDKSTILYNGKPVNYVQSIYLCDTSTPEKAIGVSDYTFVAKVNKIIKTEYRNPTTIKNGLLTSKVVYDPYTVYSISILKNIKGELVMTEDIELLQYGGLNKDGDSYTFVEDGKLLEVGLTYILMPSVIASTGEIEVSNLDSIVVIDKSEFKNKGVNSREELIELYEDAYKNEVIPVRDDGTPLLESYKSKYDVSM